MLQNFWDTLYVCELHCEHFSSNSLASSHMPISMYVYTILSANLCSLFTDSA